MNGAVRNANDVLMMFAPGEMERYGEMVERKNGELEKSRNGELKKSIDGEMGRYGEMKG